MNDHYKTSEVRSLLGYSEHCLYIGRNDSWFSIGIIYLLSKGVMKCLIKN